MRAGESFTGEWLPMKKNFDEATIQGFGEEWQRFDQTELSNNERLEIFENYFKIFPWHALPTTGGIGMDVGCGSGRWAEVVAPRVEKLYLLDASQNALSVAKKRLKNSNVEFICKTIDEKMFSENALDFAYSLGVLHHLPDTERALSGIFKILKPGAPFLVYLYYKFDNRPWYFKLLWKMSEGLRYFISRTPFRLRAFISEVIAYIIYWPLARIALWLEKFAKLPSAWPLAFYRNKSLYTMRTDALDRFGTRLEKRFTKAEIKSMLKKSGFERIVFSDSAPYWCAVGFKNNGSETSRQLIK
jgi:ubiquinone/menaquinone biosynthesis C-methylase UbiE